MATIFQPDLDDHGFAAHTLNFWVFENFYLIIFITIQCKLTIPENN